jgi:hypothetical protein
LSDPFTDIDNEVIIEKFKKFFYKFKVPIFIIISTLIILIISIIFYTKSAKKKELQISNYYIEILSIIDTEKEKALLELEKLAKLDNKSYKTLSNLLIFKIKAEEKKLDEAIEILKSIENNINPKNQINKIITYYYSQVFLDKKDQNKFENKTNKLLSYGGMWAMLAYELRGHYFYSTNEYESAFKNFSQIINNQQATNSIKNRAREMINNINLYYEKNS